MMETSSSPMFSVGAHSLTLIITHIWNILENVVALAFRVPRWMLLIVAVCCRKHWKALDRFGKYFQAISLVTCS